MSSLLNKNLELIYPSTENMLINMQTDELRNILKQSLVDNDIQTMVDAANLYTQSFLDIQYKPSWLKSEFDSDQWRIIFSKKQGVTSASSTVIAWDKIKLDDGEFLNAPHHSKLLNTFKRWIINIDNPSLNGGRITSLASSQRNLYYIIKLIECIIHNGAVINLSEMHLSLITKDFLIDMLVSIVTVDEYGVPKYLRFKEYFRKILLENSLRYDYLLKNKKTHRLSKSSIYKEMADRKCLVNIFNFNDDEYNKVNKYIAHKFVVNNIFDCSMFQKYFFRNKLLSSTKSMSFLNCIVHEDYHKTNEKKFYGLYDSMQSTSNLSCTTENVDDVNSDSIRTLVKLLKQLSFAADQERISLDSSIFSAINSNEIIKLVNIAERGRFRTLPVAPMLNLMRDTFEFAFKNIDEILESVIDVFDFQCKFVCKRISLNKYARYNFTDLVNALYPEKLVCGDYLSSNVDIATRKVSLKSNTLINRYNILISSVQFLFAIFSAKRLNEINSLKPCSNLIPNLNPDNMDHTALFSVESLVMKTGVVGPNEVKAVTQRPMIRSVARLMWKIESFNKIIMRMGIELPSLFNLLTGSEKRLNFAKSPVISPYKYICDYFDTPFVNENGIPKKLYFSNHQLRRFFAMIFFWSNGYDGLDSIRWMLGHSSSEHLYHYITESSSGAVLNGVKATHLVNEVQNGKLETIDVLRKAISQYYDVAQANIEIERLSDAVRDYVGDEDYETIPSYISDTDINAIEDTIYQLLHDDVIRLEPTFFTVERGGVTVQDYRMILEVRELF